ncbi:Protein angel 1 [Halocaridina rubra]|uniref:Protein angel 1 n=1 Tax=Halocaridina rubra TaxID=373956 RepID=A0AAN8XHB8_HALRR
MSSCMHRILLSRGFYKSVAATGGDKTGGSPQVWVGVWKVLLRSTHHSSQSCSLYINSSPHGECWTPYRSKEKTEYVYKTEQVNTEEALGLEGGKEVEMASPMPGISQEGKTKRSREFVSPIRPVSSKKFAKGKERHPKSPPIICLDDIPLPKVKRSPKIKTASVEFVPLHISPPPPLPADDPPLPPPLPVDDPPLPPPPPSHTEMEERLSDFYFIDRNATSTLFPVPLPPHFMNSSASVCKTNEIKSSSKAAYEVCAGSDSEEIYVVSDSDKTLRERLENIDLLDRNKNINNNYNQATSTTKCCKVQDNINIVFEGTWPWPIRSSSGSPISKKTVLGKTHFNGNRSIPLTAMQLRNIHQSTKEFSPSASSENAEPDVITLDDSLTSPVGSLSVADSRKKHSSSQEKQQLLRKKVTPDAQVRGCHLSTKHGLKTVEKIAESEVILDGSEPDVISLDSRACSVLQPATSEDFISLNSEADRLSKDGKGILHFECSSKVKKSKKSKGKSLREKPSSSSQIRSDASRELSPDIQKVSVIDPDVVEIDESFPNTSTSTTIEVIDVCNDENKFTSESTLEENEIDANVIVEEMDVVDVYESENNSSDCEDQGLDLSTGDFVALGNVRLKNLENNKIELEDEVRRKRERLERLRKWDMTNLGVELLMSDRRQKRGTVFSIMSYNVLAQQLLEDNKYLYKNCKEKHLMWPYRWSLLQHEVDDQNPDILMLQEVQASHYYSHFLPWLKFRGYEGIYKKRTGEKCDGCAIFYKTNKFSLVEQCTVEYNQPKAKNLLDRDNIGIIAKLTPVGNKKGSEVCLATTHFLYNPRRHDIKLAQAVLLMTELDRICYQGEHGGQTQYCPVILTGDFNAEHRTSMLDFVREGRLHYEGMSSRTLNPFGSSYPILGHELIPRSLGITDRCQHAILAQSRLVEKLRGSLFSLSDKRKIEQSLIRFRNSDQSQSKFKDGSGGCDGPSPSGWFTHDFKLKSVYSHYRNRAPEATTFHDRWTTVDYIFYSRVYSQERRREVEGPLKLLGRYSLLLGPEAKNFGPLPSAVCPSDHFPLAAQFLLQD